MRHLLIFQILSSCLQSLFRRTIARHFIYQCLKYSNMPGEKLSDHLLIVYRVLRNSISENVL